MFSAVQESCFGDHEDVEFLAYWSWIHTHALGHPLFNFILVVLLRPTTYIIRVLGACIIFETIFALSLGTSKVPHIYLKYCVQSDTVHEDLWDEYEVICRMFTCKGLNGANKFRNCELSSFGSEMKTVRLRNPAKSVPKPYHRLSDAAETGLIGD